MGVLDLVGVAVGRGGRPVLSGIDLSVTAGERIALVGGNGTGKTTLLRAMCGLDAPLAGAISWSGGPLPRGPARARTLGVLFQGEGAAPFSVRELVTLGLGLDGPPAASARRQVEAALLAGGLGALADRACTALSGGESQRALLARALVAEPPLLLLDEPTNHLDPARRARLLAALDANRGRVAVVLATHDLDCAASCDRVLVLGQGRVLAAGAPALALAPAVLEPALGVRVRRVEDPEGGPPLLRIVGPARLQVGA